MVGAGTATRDCGCSFRQMQSPSLSRSLRGVSRAEIFALSQAIIEATKALHIRRQNNGNSCEQVEESDDQLLIYAVAECPYDRGCNVVSGVRYHDQKEAAPGAVVQPRIDNLC